MTLPRASETPRTQKSVSDDSSVRLRIPVAVAERRQEKANRLSDGAFRVPSVSSVAEHFV